MSIMHIKVIHKVVPYWCPLVALFDPSSLVFVLSINSQDKGPRGVPTRKSEDGIPKFNNTTFVFLGCPYLAYIMRARYVS
jgi:hypothetical protein